MNNESWEKCSENEEQVKSHALLSRRTAILGGIAGLVLATEELTIGLLRRKIRETTDRQELDLGIVGKMEASIQEKLESYTKNSLPYIEYWDNIFNYAYISSIDKIEEKIAKWHRDGHESLSESQNQLLKQFLSALYKTGFLDKFKKYRAENLTNKKNNNIIIIPYFHGDKDELKFDLQQKGMAIKNYKDVSNILRILGKMPHKIFFEGTGGEIPLKQKIIPILKKRFPNLDTKESLKQYIQKDETGRYRILFDPELNIFGLEHTPFQLHERSVDLIDEFGNIGVLLSAFFQGILREQYAIEKAINLLSEGETGIIVIGGLHTRTMIRYLSDVHPAIKYKVIIPKHYDYR